MRSPQAHAGHGTLREDLAAVGDSLRRGLADFTAKPTVAFVLVVLYPVIGLILYRSTFDRDLLPLILPLASGFALVGPIALIAFYEISRRRANHESMDRALLYRSLTMSEVVPAAIVGLVLLAINTVWLATASLLYRAIMPEDAAGDLASLVTALFTTAPGWTLLVVGGAIGFVYALLVLAIGAMSLPAIIDRGIGAGDAMALSVKAFLAHPRLLLIWGFVVAAGLFIGSLPAFVGLLVVLPVLGHGTWHLYRHLFPRPRR